MYHGLQWWASNFNCGVLSVNRGFKKILIGVVLLIVAFWARTQDGNQSKPDINLALKNLAVAQRDFNALRSQCEVQIQSMPQYDRLKAATTTAMAACRSIGKNLDDNAIDCKEPPAEKK